MTDTDRLPAIADALSIGRLRRHVFLCADQTVPRCSSVPESRETWIHLKRLSKELGLASPPPPWRDDPTADPVREPGDGIMLRTKVDCLRICEDGPIAVVYPEGVWYRRVTPEVMERIVREHVIEGRVVTEHAFAVDDLHSGDT
ncbi:MAG: hypothetical protein QY307_05725 [Acidimicrobiia bacterium]|nr:MAG: hypothetical protein QY307_05725 [Acidimicrobiia bacterium]